MASAIDLFRALHIASGAVALATFAIPLAARKGSRLHRRAGSVYVWAMYFAVVAAVGAVSVRLATLPASQHARPLFLAYVALLSFASCFYGVRVLRQRSRTAPVSDPVDLCVPVLLVVASAAMALYGALRAFPLGYLFSPLGLAVAVPQLRALRSVPEGKRWWLREHLRAMLVATIGTLTAFLVVNAARFAPGAGVWPWFVPTALGVPAMIFWRRQYEER